jgi:hypothetical protein
VEFNSERNGMRGEITSRSASDGVKTTPNTVAPAHCAIKTTSLVSNPSINCDNRMKRREEKRAKS